jgi:excisionase family DNA binding protein
MLSDFAKAEASDSGYHTGSEPMSDGRGARRDANVRRPSEQKQSKPGAEGPGEVREFYTVSQLADLLQLTEMTIYRMVNRGELPCYAIGRVKRFRYRDVEEFLDACRVPATKAKPPRR